MITPQMIVLTAICKTIFFCVFALFAHKTHFDGSTIILIITALVFCSFIYDAVLVIYTKLKERQPGSVLKLRFIDAFRVNMPILVIVALSLTVAILSRNNPDGIFLFLATGFSLPLVITTPIVFGIVIFIHKIFQQNSSS